MKKHIVTLILLSCFGGHALASDWFNLDILNNKNKSAKIDPDLAKKGLTQNQDDITSDQDLNKLQLTAEQKHQALVWGLSQDDEKRYVFLMQNKSGFYWQQGQLSPVEILGINARSPEERQKYAKLYAVQSQQRIGKELAWMVSASNAKKELNGNLPLVQDFDVSPYSPYASQTALQNGDKLFLFTTTSTHIRHITSTLLKRLDKTQFQVNVYFIDKPNKAAVQKWATSQQIPVQLVKRGVITLNNNAGAYRELKGEQKLPAMVLVRNGKSQQVDLSRF